MCPYCIFCEWTQPKTGMGLAWCWWGGPKCSWTWHQCPPSKAHTAHLGHPTVSDGKYSSASTFEEDCQWCPRNFLHRHLVAFFDHRGEYVQVTEELPSDLPRVLLELEPRADGWSREAWEEFCAKQLRWFWPRHGRLQRFSLTEMRRLGIRYDSWNVERSWQFPLAQRNGDINYYNLGLFHSQHQWLDW